MTEKLKCLVTGGAGFIGSNLALELEKQGHSVTVIDNLSTGNIKNLEGFKGTFIEANVAEELQLDESFDAIFHQGAITDPREPDDEKTYNENLQGFKNMVALAQKTGAKLVYASTAGLYGNGPVPMNEDQEKEILSVYGKSKLESDEIAKTLFDKMHIVGLRYFNVFGPREKFKGRPASMIYHLAVQMKHGKNPRIFKHGEQIRDHIYVKDVVRANILALDVPSGVCNVGTGIGTSFNELIAVLNDALATMYDPEYFDMPYDPKTYQNNTQADTKKAEKQLKFKTEFTLRTGIADYFDWLDDIRWYDEFE